MGGMSQRIHDYLDALALVVILAALYYALPYLAQLIHMRSV